MSEEVPNCYERAEVNLDDEEKYSNAQEYLKPA